MLDPAALIAGYREIHFSTLASTNEDALVRARAGEADTLWIVAESQTQGRGRVGRVWSSPPGNLYASLMLRDPADMRKAPELGFVAGLALARAVAEILGDSEAFRIKWPNDLVRGSAKFAGLLVEGTQLAGGGYGCVIGFGVNCASHPMGLEYPTTAINEYAY